MPTRCSIASSALIGERDIEIVYTGARPGEKIDEVLISEEEIRHTRRDGEYFVVTPMLPEIAKASAEHGSTLDSEYNSADSLLDLEQTAALLRANGLMPDQAGVGLEEDEPAAAVG